MSNDDVVARLNERVNEPTVYARQSRGDRRQRKGKRPRVRGVALSQKPWTQPTFPQVYDFDKRGKFRGTT